MYHESISLDGVSIHTGFPNPAIDASLQDLDLNQLLIQHSVATYFMRIDGDEWRHVGIQSGDILLVDRALTAHGNDLVVWWDGSEFIISPLHACTKNAQVFGVVTTAIHQFKKKHEQA